MGLFNYVSFNEHSEVVRLVSDIRIEEGVPKELLIKHLLKKRKEKKR